jgi:2-polyprenyl-3-methyl-5-hydroxy-6-metoxy-1,4-benzoquinol methylase
MLTDATLTTEPNATRTASLTSAPPLDQQRQEAFGERMMQMLNEASLALMLSIGHRTRLFDTMAGMPPATIAEIAGAAELSERYVRECLGALATGGIVTYDAGSQTYDLPAEHAAWLTRAASPNNVAVTMQYFAILGSAETDVVEACKNGKGVAYCQYPRFHEVMAEESAQTTVAGLNDHILPMMDGMQEKMRNGIDVLDIGCGRGKALRFMAAMYPNSRFAGYDLSEQAIENAKRDASKRDLRNTRFAARDLTELDEVEQYDLITAFDAVHDQKDPARVLANIHRALKPGGTFMMQDIAASSDVAQNMDHPMAPFIYTISTMHCMSVSLAQGGAGLGAAWGRELAVRMLKDAGFKSVEVRELPHDPQNYYYTVTK